MGLPSKGTGVEKERILADAPKGGGKGAPTAGDTPTDPREPKAGKGKKGKQPSQIKPSWTSPRQVRDKIKLTSGRRLTPTKGKRARTKRARKETTKVERTVPKGPGGKTPPRARGKNNNTNVEWPEGSQQWTGTSRGAKRRQGKEAKARGKGKGWCLHRRTNYCASPTPRKKEKAQQRLRGSTGLRSQPT